jgi:hypothetical protein
MHSARCVTPTHDAQAVHRGEMTLGLQRLNGWDWVEGRGYTLYTIHSCQRSCSSCKLQATSAAEERRRSYMMEIERVESYSL